MLRYYKPSDTGFRRWEKRLSERGYPYWVRSEVMPALDPRLLSSVFFVYPSLQDAKNSTELGGTGFFFWIPSGIVENMGYCYAVTCWHVLYDTKPNPVLRIN